MRLKFTRDGYVDGELKFKKGETYDIPEKTGSAARWIKRGALEVKEENPKAKKPVRSKPTVKPIVTPEVKVEEVIEEVKETIIPKGNANELPAKDIL